MALIKIEAGKEKRIPTSGRFLTIAKANDIFYASNSEAGIKEFQLKQNAVVETQNVNFLILENKTVNEITIEYQSQDLRVYSDSSSIEIIGTVTVDKIEEGINVATSVGSVEILPANTTEDLIDIVLAPSEKRLLIGADDTRKELTIQLSGNDFVTCRVGSTNIADNRGKILQGGGGQVGSMSHSATDAVYIKNTTLSAVTVSLGVEKRV